MKKTKIFILFMGALLVLGLSACGKKTLEDLIVGRWQDPQEGTISCFNEDGSYELNGEQIGYYSVEKNHLEIYLYDSRIPATKLYGDVELNGDDYFSGYFVLENEDGEIVEEDNEAFARLGSGINNSDTNITENSNEEENEYSDSEEDLTLENIVVGHWTTDRGPGHEEFEYNFLENGRFEFNGGDAGTYTVTGNTLEYVFDVDDVGEKVEWQVDVQTRDEFIVTSSKDYYNGTLDENNNEIRVIRID